MIFGKLPPAQVDDVRYAFDRGGAHVGRELRVAENRQAFLEAELEPVPAGDAVARPVVEILMGDDGFDPFKVHVG